MKDLSNRNPNPATKSSPHRPEDYPSKDSRDGHGLSEDEVLKGKK